MNNAVSSAVAVFIGLHNICACKLFVESIKYYIPGTNSVQSVYRNERIIPLAKPNSDIVEQKSSMPPKPYEEEIIIEPAGDDGIVYGNQTSL
uniref:Uncharacterized protein n=1 Tax=Syphacia muris TaxID=451379 RepID=A0A0N5AAE8_9BILA